LVGALESLARETETFAGPDAPHVNGQPVPARGFDIDNWLSSRGLEITKGPEPYNGGRRWTLRSCPFNPEHKTPVIIQLVSGALSYTCLHKSCAENGWKAFRERFEPGYRGTNGFAAAVVASADTTPLITNISQIPSVWRLEAKIAWCVEDIIAEGSVTLISAESGTGKTWLAYFIAGCVAHGLPILGRRVKQSKVFYLDGENPLYLVKQRLWDLGISETPELAVWGGWNASPPPGPQSPIVHQFAREQKGLIIFDSLIEFHPGSEQSSTETRAYMRYFRALANLGATVVVLHNAGKAETAKLYRGSSDIKAAVDTAYLLQRTAEDQSNKLGKLLMTCFKGRLMPGQNFGLEFHHKEGFVPCEHVQIVLSVEEIIREILAEHSGSNQSAIVSMARAKGCGKGQIEKCLKSTLWFKAAGPNNSILYSLPPEGSE
jgi:hypothetical protein